MADDKRITAKIDHLRFDQLHLGPPTPPQTTSPDSPMPSEALPISSSVDKIISELHNRRCGRPQVEEDWWSVNLSIDEYNAFETRLKADEDLQNFVVTKKVK